MEHEDLSVIIAVYNEVRTIGSIVEIVRTWGKAGEIVVVNDGSTDKTQELLGQFTDSIRVISYKTNKGKGYAIERGISLSSGSVLMFLDGDVVGLTHKDLDRMLTPVVLGKADMVIGVAQFWNAGSFEPFNDLSGERVLFRKNVLDHLHLMKNIGYGVELLLNDLHKTKRVLSVRLPYVNILKKIEKQSVPDATLSFIKEARELVAQLVRQQTSDLMTPQTRRVYGVISRYLKQAFDYFQ